MHDITILPVSILLEEEGEVMSCHEKILPYTIRIRFSIDSPARPDRH